MVSVSITISRMFRPSGSVISAWTCARAPSRVAVSITMIGPGAFFGIGHLLLQRCGGTVPAVMPGRARTRRRCSAADGTEATTVRSICASLPVSKSKRNVEEDRIGADLRPAIKAARSCGHKGVHDRFDPVQRAGHRLRSRP